MPKTFFNNYVFEFSVSNRRNIYKYVNIYIMRSKHLCRISKLQKLALKNHLSPIKKISENRKQENYDKIVYYTSRAEIARVANTRIETSYLPL